jgi:hypothetical protein
MAPSRGTLDQTVPVENRVDGALGWKPNVAFEPPKQKLADLAGSPCGFSPFRRTIKFSSCCGS